MTMQYARHDVFAHLVVFAGWHAWSCHLEQCGMTSVNNAAPSADARPATSSTAVSKLICIACAFAGLLETMLPPRLTPVGVDALPHFRRAAA